LLFDRERSEQRLEALGVIGRGPLEMLDACARQRAQAVARERGLELEPIALEPLQREVGAAALFAERRVRLREQPRNAGDERKVGVTAGAAPGGAWARERLVAARTREELVQSVGCRHAAQIGSRSRIVAAIRGTGPCTDHVM